MSKRRKMELDKKYRYDGYANTLTGVGIALRDKRLATSAVASALPESEAEQIYSADFIAAKMVDILPEDMVREGFKLIVPDMPDEDLRKIMEYIEYTLSWKAKFRDLMSWGRLYGGAALLLGVDDGAADLSKPLDWSNVKKFDYMTLFHRWELRADDLQKDPSLPGYGLPISYAVQPATTNGMRIISRDANKTIHASRLIRFDGCRLPRRLFETNGYWHDSILSKRKMALADYSHSYDSVASLMSDVSQAIFKIKNMHEIMSAEDGKQVLMERLDLLEMSRSVVNAMMIAEEEDFERKTTSFTGIPEMLRKFEERLVATSEYPHTILLGEAPGSGLGETGKAELRDYYDSVARKQETQLKPILKVMLRAVFVDQNGPTKGKEPESWDIEFNPLWQDSLSDTLEQRAKQATIDQIYIQTGVLSPDEVADARFASGQYNHETALLLNRDPADSTDFDVTSDTQEETDTEAPMIVVKPKAGAQSAGSASTNKVTSAQESLNGAQVTSLLDIINAVAAGTLPRESGVNLIKIAFALSDENAEAVMGEVGKSFTPKPAEPAKPASPNPAQTPRPASDDLSALDR